MNARCGSCSRLSLFGAVALIASAAACGGATDPGLAGSDGTPGGPGLRADVAGSQLTAGGDTAGTHLDVSDAGGTGDTDGLGPTDESPDADADVEAGAPPLTDSASGPPDTTPLPQDASGQDAPELPGPEPDVSLPEPDLIEPGPEIIEPEPDVIGPLPDVIEPVPDVIEPEPDVIEPVPDVIEPGPDVIVPEPDIIAPEPDIIAPEPDIIAPGPDAPEADGQEPEPELPEPEPDIPVGEPDLPPDPSPYPQLEVEPDAPVAGSVSLVHIWDTEPWANVGLAVAGPCGGAAATWGGVASVTPGVWRWTYEVAFPSAGNFELTFTRDAGTAVVISTVVTASGPSWCPGDYPLLEVEPAAPTAGAAAVVSAWDTTPWGFVGLSVDGPCGGATPEWLGADEVEPGLWRWQLAVTFPAAGTYALSFTGDDGATAVIAGSVAVGGSVVCPGAPPPDNAFGTVIIGSGSDPQLDLARDLVGAGGHITMILAGVTPASTGPDASWVAGVQAAYDRDLVPVLRIGPPWGQMEVREWSDDADHMDYTTLAAAWQAVVAGLPLRESWPLYVQVHNEPNLCHEWRCSGGGWLPAETAAAEYAHFFRDVAEAIHALDEPRIQVAAAALAAGGAASCECCDSNACAFEGGQTGLDFMAAMQAAVPDVWTHLDFLASHSFPAEGEGWGFFVPYDDAWPGLTWFQQEQSMAGAGLPVIVTETGWSTARPIGGPFPSEQDMADWTVETYQALWLQDPSVTAACPFLLMDPVWGDAEGFGWVWSDGTPRPVYQDVRALRCSLDFAGSCP